MSCHLVRHYAANPPTRNRWRAGSKIGRHTSCDSHKHITSPLGKLRRQSEVDAIHWKERREDHGRPTDGEACDRPSDAIRENRGASILCYALVILFAVTGVAVLIGGAFAREGLVSLAGSVASILFWPALNQARQIRELNLTIRLLEIPLSRAENANEAADALRVVFLQRFQVKEQQ